MSPTGHSPELFLKICLSSVYIVGLLQRWGQFQKEKNQPLSDNHIPGLIYKKKTLSTR
jgi:hypothetical protein